MYACVFVCVCVCVCVCVREGEAYTFASMKKSEEMFTLVSSTFRLCSLIKSIWDLTCRL